MDAATAAPPLDHRPGDLWAFSGQLPTSRAIKFFTCSRYSHVGGIAYVSHSLLNRLEKSTKLHFKPDAFHFNRWQPRFLLFHSTTLGDQPCELQRTLFSGVQAQNPEAALASYPGHVYRIRLRNGYALDSNRSELLSTYLVKQVGLPYDRNQAALSGTRFLKHWLWSPADFHHVFCSELWAGALMELQRLPLQNPSKVNPGRLIHELVDYGIYSDPERLK